MLFGLLGKDISYSFSKNYFTKKFKEMQLPYHYQNIDLANITSLPDYLANTKHLQGFNVTIPYKEAILEYLDEIDPIAKAIGAVNCVKITNNKLKGYNTDAFGFEHSLKPLLNNQTNALILGTGGASKAIAFSLRKLNINYKFVSRHPTTNQLSYTDLTKTIIQTHTLIINTTPLGTKNKLENQCPNIPYKYLTKKHLLYDLIYTPSETLFLKKGKKNDVIAKNGLEMLILQAEESWRIWKSPK